MRTVATKSLCKQFSDVDLDVEPDDAEIFQDIEDYKRWLNEMDADQSTPQTSGMKPSENKEPEGTMKQCGVCKHEPCI